MISGLQTSTKNASFLLQKHFLDVSTNTQIKVAIVAVSIFAALVLLMLKFLSYPKKENMQAKKIDRQNESVKVPQPPIESNQPTQTKPVPSTEDHIPEDGAHQKNETGNIPNSSSHFPNKEPTKIVQPQDSLPPS